MLPFLGYPSKTMPGIFIKKNGLRDFISAAQTLFLYPLYCWIEAHMP